MHFLTTDNNHHQKSISKGVTAPLRVDPLRRDAAARRRILDRLRAKPRRRSPTAGPEVDFVDSYRYTCSPPTRFRQPTGLDHMMPVTVERTYDSKSGRSAGGWTPLDEGQRLKQHVEPPDAEAWNQQMHRMRVFTALSPIPIAISATC